jgi:hypothetical protein
MRDHQDFFDLIGFVLAEGDDGAVLALMRAISEQRVPPHIPSKTADMHPNLYSETGAEM